MREPHTAILPAIGVQEKRSICVALSLDATLPIISCTIYFSSLFSAEAQTNNRTNPLCSHQKLCAYNMQRPEVANRKLKCIFKSLDPYPAECGHAWGHPSPMNVDSAHLHLCIFRSQLFARLPRIVRLVWVRLYQYIVWAVAVGWIEMWSWSQKKRNTAHNWCIEFGIVFYADVGFLSHICFVQMRRLEASNKSTFNSVIEASWPRLSNRYCRLHKFGSVGSPEWTGADEWNSTRTHPYAICKWLTRIQKLYE